VSASKITRVGARHGTENMHVAGAISADDRQHIFALLAKGFSRNHVSSGVRVSIFTVSLIPLELLSIKNKTIIFKHEEVEAFLMSNVQLCPRLAAIGCT
jgi:hypothetical protein